MTALIDPEQIPLTNAAFRKWMGDAGLKLEELDEQHYDILTNYYLDLNDKDRDSRLHILRWDLVGLKIAMKATMSLWGQLRDEMN
jgi:hypothetical protein